MANICDTQYKVTGSRKAVADLWNTLQELEVNSNNVYLYLLAEHYGIDYEKKGISVRGHIYWAEQTVSIVFMSSGSKSVAAKDMLIDNASLVVKK